MHHFRCTTVPVACSTAKHEFSDFRWLGLPVWLETEFC